MAEVEFDMDGVQREAKRRLQKLQAIDQDLDALDKAVERAKRKDPMGLVAAAQRQGARARAAGAGGAALPPFPGRFAPGAGAGPPPPAVAAGVGAVAAMAARGGGGGAPPAGGGGLPFWQPGQRFNPNQMQLPPGFVAGGAGAIPGAIAGALGKKFTSLSTAVEKTATALTGPFGYALATATAMLSTVGRMADTKLGNAAEASSSLGARHLEASRTAALLGTNAEQVFNRINTSADPDATMGLLRALRKQRGTQQGAASPAHIDMAMKAIDIGIDPEIVQDLATNRRWAQLSRLMGKNAPKNEPEIRNRVGENVAQTEAWRSADPDWGMPGRTADANFKRWQNENPVESTLFGWIPGMRSLITMNHQNALEGEVHRETASQRPLDSGTAHTSATVSPVVQPAYPLGSSGRGPSADAQHIVNAIKDSAAKRPSPKAGF